MAQGAKRFQVAGVDPCSPAGRWNQRSSGAAIRRGDELFEVNGLTKPLEMRLELSEARRVRLLFRRERREEREERAELSAEEDAVSEVSEVSFYSMSSTSSLSSQQQTSSGRSCPSTDWEFQGYQCHDGQILPPFSRSISSGHVPASDSTASRLYQYRVIMRYYKII